ncbi:MAG: single-stranded DNA-binding protein [Treponema sp.]|nr:single-stranded DNA-binding protein [Treponema sp.]
MISSKIVSCLKKISFDLAVDCGALCFGPETAAVYNPLVYAKRSHYRYLELAGNCWAGSGGANTGCSANTSPAETLLPKKIIFVGMNPGPWGMAQTGVPFGEVAAVRDWLGIEAAVGKPEHEHPKRLVEGFACKRAEVSGRRLWGLFRERFGTPQVFFRGHFVTNYCPLLFMGPSGVNITPDKLPADQAAPLFEICDKYLARTIKLLQPQWVIGIGGFAKKRIDLVREKYFGNQSKMTGKAAGQFCESFKTAQILHPSPASPKANAGWDREVTETLVGLGIWS